MSNINWIQLVMDVLTAIAAALSNHNPPPASGTGN
jgi:hypothetical protein